MGQYGRPPQALARLLVHILTPNFTTADIFVQAYIIVYCCKRVHSQWCSGKFLFRERQKYLRKGRFPRSTPLYTVCQLTRLRQELRRLLRSTYYSRSVKSVFISRVAVQSIERKQVLEHSCHLAHVCLSVCQSVRKVYCGKTADWM